MAGNRIAHYDPSAVIILIAGVIPVESVVNGTFVEIEKDLQTFTSVKSTDGQIYRTMNADTSYTLTLSLSSVSDSNAILEYLLYADQLTQLAKFPILIKDTSGSSLFFSTTCWIEDQPILQFSDNVEARRWTIKCAEGGLHFGDNYGASAIGEDSLRFITSALPILDGLLR